MRRRAKACGRCDKAVGQTESGVKCHWCAVWFHARCEGVPHDLSRALADHQDQSAWLCKVCQGELRTSASKISKLERLNRELQNNIERLEAKEERRGEEGWFTIINYCIIFRVHMQEE